MSKSPFGRRPDQWPKNRQLGTIPNPSSLSVGALQALDKSALADTKVTSLSRFRNGSGVRSCGRSASDLGTRILDRETSQPEGATELSPALQGWERHFRGPSPGRNGSQNIGFQAPLLFGGLPMSRRTAAVLGTTKVRARSPLGFARDERNSCQAWNIIGSETTREADRARTRVWLPPRSSGWCFGSGRRSAGIPGKWIRFFPCRNNDGRRRELGCS